MPLLFWSSALLLFYIYLGYPLLMWVWAKVRPRPFRRGEVQGTASVILAAYNEAPRLVAKIASLHAADPKGRILEILVGSDGSTDHTEAVLAALRDPTVRLVSFPERRGKPAVLNDLAKQARGDFLILTDARQALGIDAIENLLAGFTDPDVGVISGELTFRSQGRLSAAGEGMGVYWRYEKYIRKHEALAASVPGATGAFYAMRRSLFRPLEEETLLDDVVLPMQAIAQGFRCVFESEAMIFDDPSTSPGQESMRKRRTIAGCFQLVRHHPQWLLPGGHPLWFQYLSHKVLRLLSPLLLVILLVASALLAGHPFYAACLLLQVCFYAAAIGGLVLSAARVKTPGGLGAAMMFLNLNVTTLHAFWDACRGRFLVRWERPIGCDHPTNL